MNKIDQLRETRGTSYAEAQRIMDGARAEGRDLTESEAAAVDRYTGEVEQIDQRIADLEGEEQRADNSHRAFRAAGFRENELANSNATPRLPRR